jgi:hypothetical protein
MTEGLKCFRYSNVPIAQEAVILSEAKNPRISPLSLLLPLSLPLLLRLSTK